MAPMIRSGSRSSAKGRWRTARGSSSPTGATPSRQGLLAAVVFSRIRRISSSDDGEEAAPRRLKRRNTAAMSASASATSEDFLSDASSAVSSPIRVPYIPPVVTGVGDSLINVDENILDSYMRRDAKYIEKTRNQLKLVTLDEEVPYSALSSSKFDSTRESLIGMVLKVAKVVFGLSSYIDGNLLQQASGFLIDWDEESKIGTIITSAFLIRSKYTTPNQYLGEDEYAPHAEVCVHLLDKHDTVLSAELMHYHKQYNFALFKIKIDAVAQIPSFSEVKFGEKLVFILGRDKNMHLIADYGNVPYRGPNSFERNHYMFISSDPNECAPGGPVIDVSGQFLGMINLPSLAFTPSAIILKCLHMLKKFDCIPRLNIGMKFSPIKFLDPIHQEKIIRKCDVNTGLIVTEVSEGSVAEKAGVRNGDIFKCLCGESICTTIELESILLRMAEEHLENGGRIGSTVDVPVGIFYVRQNSFRTVILSLKVSADIEVIKEGEYAITHEHYATMSDSNDDEDPELRA